MSGELDILRNSSKSEHTYDRLKPSGESWALEMVKVLETTAAEANRPKMHRLIAKERKVDPNISKAEQHQLSKDCSGAGNGQYCIWHHFFCFYISVSSEAVKVMNVRVRVDRDSARRRGVGTVFARTSTTF